jgi:hypothetical protein
MALCWSGSPQLGVLGGCCSPDTRHIRQIADACLGLSAIVGTPHAYAGYSTR